MPNTQLGAESVLHNLPFTDAPPPAVMRVLSRFDRAQIEGFVEVAIGLMDLADPDPDAEPDGDEGELVAVHTDG